MKILSLSDISRELWIFFLNIALRPFLLNIELGNITHENFVRRIAQKLITSLLGLCQEMYMVRL